MQHITTCHPRRFRSYTNLNEALLLAANNKWEFASNVLIVFNTFGDTAAGPRVSDASEAGDVSSQVQKKCVYSPTPFRSGSRGPRLDRRNGVRWP